jgi:hypothetical protein
MKQRNGDQQTFVLTVREGAFIRTQQTLGPTYRRYETKNHSNLLILGVQVLEREKFACWYA